ncbi:hypothetical protein A4X03_0g6043, partial [Tilletia caries]
MATASTTSMIPLGSPRIPSSPPDRVADGAEGAQPTAAQRRTSWRDWGTSRLGSWATTTSPFRPSSSGRPLSSSSNSSSTFGFGSSLLSRARADTIVIPESDVAKQLAEQNEAILEEGERLRLPPTPAELEALEAAGIQDEEDLRLEAEERERVRSMPPPPRHPSVFSRLSGRLSAQSSPRAEISPHIEKTSLPAFPEDGEEPQVPGHENHAISKANLDTPIELPPIPLDDDAPSRNTYFPNATSQSAIDRDGGFSSPKDRPSDAPTLTPTRVSAHDVPAVMISSATSQSLAGKLASFQSPTDSVIPSPSHSRTGGDLDRFNTPITPDTRFGYDSGAYELPSRKIDMDARRSNSVASAGGNNTESESESAREDLIPADMYQDSEPEADDDTAAKLGSSTPEINEKRKSRGAQDRFSLLLSSLSRPNDLALAGSGDDAARSIGLEQTQSATEAPLTANSDYATSSASSYGESDQDDERSVHVKEAIEPDETVVLDGPGRFSPERDVKDAQVTEDVSAVVAPLTIDEPKPSSPTATFPRPAVVAKQPVPEEEDEEAGTPVIPRQNGLLGSSDHGSSRPSTSHSTGSLGDIDDFPMRSLGEELAEARHVAHQDEEEGQDGEAVASSDGLADGIAAETEGPGGAVSSPRLYPEGDKSDSSISSKEAEQNASHSSAMTVLPSSGSEEAQLGEEGDESVELPAEQETEVAKDEDHSGLPVSATTQTFVSFSQSLGEVSDADGGTAPSEAAAGTVSIAEDNGPEATEKEARSYGSPSPVNVAAEHQHDGLTPSADKARDTPSVPSLTGADQTVEAVQTPGGAVTHNRLMDALGLARSASPSPSITSVSSFASAISEGDGPHSDDEGNVEEGEGRGAEEKEEDRGAEGSAVQLAEVKIEDAEPLGLAPQNTSQASKTAEEGSNGATGLEVDQPQVLGSPRIPSSPSLSVNSPSSSRPASGEVSPATVSVTEVGESTPTPSQSTFSGTATSPLVNGTSAGGQAESVTPGTDGSAAGGLSPSLGRPLRNRNRKGLAPTPPGLAPTPPRTLTPEASGPAESSSPEVSKRSSASSASSTNQVTPTSESAVGSADDLTSAPAAAAVPAAAAPPSRPPRARPPRAKGRAAAAASAAAAPAVTSPAREAKSVSPGTPKSAGADLTSPTTPVTPGGSKRKVQRKAVPHA